MQYSIPDDGDAGSSRGEREASGNVGNRPGQAEGGDGDSEKQSPSKSPHPKHQHHLHHCSSCYYGIVMRLMSCRIQEVRPNQSSLLKGENMTYSSCYSRILCSPPPAGHYLVMMYIMVHIVDIVCNYIYPIYSIY